jgi:hypothetical protein
MLTRRIGALQRATCRSQGEGRRASRTEDQAWWTKAKGYSQSESTPRLTCSWRVYRFGCAGSTAADGTGRSQRTASERPAYSEWQPRQAYQQHTSIKQRPIRLTLGPDQDGGRINAKSSATDLRTSARLHQRHDAASSRNAPDKQRSILWIPTTKLHIFSIPPADASTPIPNRSCSPTLCHHLNTSAAEVNETIQHLHSTTRNA